MADFNNINTTNISTCHKGSWRQSFLQFGKGLSSSRILVRYFSSRISRSLAFSISTQPARAARPIPALRASLIGPCGWCVLHWTWPQYVWDSHSLHVRESEKIHRPERCRCGVWFMPRGRVRETGKCEPVEMQSKSHRTTITFFVQSIHYWYMMMSLNMYLYNDRYTSVPFSMNKRPVHFARNFTSGAGAGGDCGRDAYSGLSGAVRGKEEVELDWWATEAQLRARANGELLVRCMLYPPQVCQPAPEWPDPM